MTNKVEIVFKGFIELTETEKQEFLEEVRKYMGKSYFEKGRIDEDINTNVRRILGPTSSAHCPCCGR